MNPPIIIMDEPTSMIDPLGKQFIFQILRTLKEAGEHTLLVVEHNIEQLAPLSDQLLLMYEGQVAKIAPPAEFFDNPEYLIERGISVPSVTSFTHWLRDEGHIAQDTILPYDMNSSVELARKALKAQD
jgi:energy-coupling factor transporter ATP-binding protein EcfA2